MAFTSKAYGSGTAAAGGGKRMHTSSNNPLLVTPAKPSMKKDKKQDQNELESDTRTRTIHSTCSIHAVLRSTSLSHAVPSQQNISVGSVADEIMSMKSLLTMVVDKLEKLDTLENNIKDVKHRSKPLKRRTMR